MNSTRTKKPRRLQGVVIARKMTGVATVSVEEQKWSALYKTRYRLNKKFPAAVRRVKAEVGDRVVIQETRPLSRRVRWVIVGKIVK